MIWVTALFGLLVFALIAIGVINWVIERSARGRIFERAEDAPSAPVALVLGARVYADGQLSAMLEDRVATAVALYRAGKVKKLLMSGDNGQRDYDEVTAMRRVAISMGVPSNDVVRDFAGFRTWDSMVRARKVFQLERVVVVTQRFHLARSLYLARAAGLDAIGLVGDRREYYGPSLARSEWREIFARVLAWTDSIWKPAPHFLGPVEALDGDLQRETGA